jgi:N-glycosylase/DNA lyase
MDAEKLGSFVKDQAQDMVHHGSGFLVQSDWRRGVQRLRDGIHRARELGVVLTHRRTIFKYFMELETARSEVARQLTSDGFQQTTIGPRCRLFGANFGHVGAVCHHYEFQVWIRSHKTTMVSVLEVLVLEYYRYR